METENPDGTNKFALTTNSNYTDADKDVLVMASEHIFALNCSDLQDIINGLLVASSTSSKPDLYLQNTWISKVYENPDSDNRCRGGRYFQTSGSYAYYLKYYQSGTIEATDMVPLIRIAEMYLILIENTSLSEAQGYFETFRQARGMDYVISIGSETGKKKSGGKRVSEGFLGRRTDVLLL